MKKIKSFLGICAIASVMLFLACEEEEIPTYSGIQTISFGNSSNNYQVYSFNNLPSSYNEHYIFSYSVRTNGFVPNQERPFHVKQKMLEGVNNAIEGVHFVFDTIDYYIPANRTSALVGIRLFREDLRPDTTYTLYFELQATEDFELVKNREFLYKELVIGDVLVKPSEWDKLHVQALLGPWSRNKHQWIIDQTGYAWDDKFIKEVYAMGDAVHWREKLNLLLQEYNEKVGPLYDDQGLEIVAFP